MINLVLGGGGAKALPSVGVLHYLISNDYKISSIIGTSAGAVIGGIYAAALKKYNNDSNKALKYIYEILKFDLSSFKDRNIWGLLKFYINKLFNENDLENFGVYKGDKLHQWLLEVTDNMTFNDIDLELYITACEAITGTLVIFSKSTTPDIKIADAIRASSSIQGVFKPFVINKEKLSNAIFIDNSIKKPHTEIVNTDSLNISNLLQTSENLLLWDGGNLGNTRIDIAANINKDNNKILAVSYTYSGEMTDIELGKDILGQTINIMMKATEKVISKFANEKYDVTIIHPQSNVGTTEFDISYPRKIKLISKGIEEVDKIKHLLV